MSEPPIELESGLLPDPPDLPGRVLVFESPEAAIDLAIRELQVVADAAVRERGRFQLAVSGDQSLEPVWARLMVDPDLRMFPWPNTHLWVMEPHADYTRMQESLITPAGIAAEHVHPMPTNEVGAGETSAPPLSHDLAARPLDAVILSLTPREPAQAGPHERDLIQAARTTRIMAIDANAEAAVTAIQADPTAHLSMLARTYRGDLRWYFAASPRAEEGR